MKLVFILFDSLNRKALSCYNPKARPTPAFDRLASRSLQFNNHYCGSLPCMPARRDLLTGRLNFLHRSWGPIEPFDKCFPTLLKEHGVYSHLISDHYHYWEEGGCGYHNKYSSAEFVRGQERDLWKAMVEPPAHRFREQYHEMLSGVERRSANMVNREFIRDESDFPITSCVSLAEEFLDNNHKADNWMLQLELFDPHEPFTAPERFRTSSSNEYSGAILDWPTYDKLNLNSDERAELQGNYDAIVAMCDHNLGRLLDTFDQYDLWSDTAIILTTDHGFLLGEHDWWGKNRMPAYDPIVHIPLMFYHPQAANGIPGSHFDGLTQCLDINETILDLFDSSSTVDRQETDDCREGYSLLPCVLNNSRLLDSHVVREHALFGIFGGAINITDGRYTYFHYPENLQSPFYEYTLMPVHPASHFVRDEFSDAQLLQRKFRFTDGYPVLKLPAIDSARRPPMQGGALDDAVSVLYDLKNDPVQNQAINDEQLRASLQKEIVSLMQKNGAPEELYTRFNLSV